MSQHTPRLHRAALALPASAPLVRITAGSGSPGQKTWNLRRPVTLIGSRRPASIVLHDRNISAAHCVIVNTGSDVLLKDLHTSSGTRCNKEQVDLALLGDGDVIVVGDMSIQVAIQVANNEAGESGCGVAFADPTKFPESLTLGLADDDTEWLIEDAVALIGRHPDASVRLGNEAVSTRHAIVFSFAGGAAIFELGSRTGITINGAQCASAMLMDGDHLAVGPCALRVGRCDPAALDAESSDADGPAKLEQRSGSDPSYDQARRPGSAGGESSSVDPASRAAGFSLRERPPQPKPAARDAPASLENLGTWDDPGRALERIAAQLGTLQQSMAASWEQLNSRETQLQDHAAAVSKQASDLATLAAELDAKDAALCGRLHDVRRSHEEITARERELPGNLARIQADRSAPNATQAAGKRLANCPHCGKPVNLGGTDPAL